MNPPRSISPLVALVALALVALALAGCPRGQAGERAQPSASASAPPSAEPPASASAPAPTASASSPADAIAAVDVRPPVTAFTGARAAKECHAQTLELATYQQRGDVALAGGKDDIAAAWWIRLAGREDQQIAFASFDKEGKPIAKARGVGLSGQDTAPRVFAAGAEWTVVWFDDKGLAWTRPKLDPLPPTDISHLGAVGSDVAGDVALAPDLRGAVLAAAPFGADKAQLGIFVFAPAEEGAPQVRALGVTHHAKLARRAAVASNEGGTFVAWSEGGSLHASHFDPAGKETPAACTVAAASGAPRERFSLAATSAGAIAMWVEGPGVHTRALDASGCPASPVWTVGDGKWASIAPLGDGALVTWVDAGGRVLAARLGANGAPASKGLDAGEGSSGAKDVPAVASFGARAAFAWAEVMSPIISTKRLVLRIVDAACIP